MTNKDKVQNRSDRGKLIAVIGGAALLIGASFGVQAIAESKTYQHAKLYMTGDQDTYSFTHKAGWGKGRHHRGERFSNMSDEEINKKVSRMAKHLAVEIDATDDQTAKITALATAVAKDMRPLHKDFREAGMQMKELLLAKSIDRDAIEKLRAERIAEADRVSKELVKAASDVAEVLTPEQRATVAERIEEFRSKRRRWRRG